MGLFRGVKKAAGKVVDIRVDKWMSFNSLRENTSKTAGMVKNVFTPEKATHTETFEQAMARLNLTDNDLKARQKEFTRLFLFFLFLGLIVIAYGIYMAITSRYLVALISTCISLYIFSQAFRFHFWLFQIRQRKLGCTLSEWFNSEIKKHPSKQSLPTRTKRR